MFAFLVTGTFEGLQSQSDSCLSMSRQTMRIGGDGHQMYLVSGTEYLVSRTVYLVFGTVYLVSGTVYLVSGTGYLVSRTVYLVSVAVYFVFGTEPIRLLLKHVEANYEDWR